jgi:hypothetical protein
MKLVTFEVSTTIGAVLRVGALNGDKVSDLTLGYTRYLSDNQRAVAAWS